MPYVMPDTTEKPVASPWPREYSTLTLPLSRNHYGEITLPVEMTEREWRIMMDILALMKVAKVGKQNPASASGLGSGGGEDYSLSPSSEEHAPDKLDSSDDRDTRNQYTPSGVRP